MSRFVVTASWWDNAPHLSDEAKAELEASIPPYQKDARTRGIPQLGAGIIFPVPEEDLLVEPFEIPRWWPRGYGLDVGWNRTAAIWRALDIDRDPPVSYFYDEYYRGEADPTIHGAAIRKRAGLWMPGRIDPASRGRNQDDGDRLLELYRKAIYGEDDIGVGARLLGLANNAVESGLYDMLILMNQGLLKVFKGRCPNWLAERRIYRRDEKGKIIKKHDHAIDASRYNVASGTRWLKAEPPLPPADPLGRFASRDRNLHWMAG